MSRHVIQFCETKREDIIENIFFFNVLSLQK
jgi:hypothetical protein